MGFLEFLAQYWPRLLSGTWVTILIFACSAVLSIALSMIAGLCKLAPTPLLRAVAVCYVELFRGTSLLVQLYWIFFVLPLFGLTIEKFTAGCLAIGLNIGAYGAELVKGAVLAVPRGQWEAALAINMAPAQRMRRVILPQALVIALPAWGNLLIELLKATALVSLISVSDVMFEAKQINGQTFLSAQVFGAALVIYYILARFLLTPGMRSLEKRMRSKLGSA
ncbi:MULTISPECIES: ectoine/hydroxyectoine ABC transporter permease subunit EhuC [unclassified Mesorhizobium]|uniref:ectoine/hydroxyectoine ABC transporter permease subunit EhuC n=1 Tax=unclassified Mesorhizobium TaxID=325217 RepID=UPI000FCBBFFC|nr:MULTISPECIES: ectoine/hydroxyectoine ABC transporter permease subunit EhuC [unclassified Mesorhizobium]RUX07939.1 ectoine/hydroxyectoine ABC transporter permease subunit EhuC [Mesorhizobium sp. M8A.F.Ca.ET.023.01.1.1]RVD59562.1 ectoine/hydroxyectoine ABC transporter permease subunit EhuC [Mesorhizobium sp. M8A.F.Ca.ET.023.02.2.1]TGR36938.1 ectoine/hydroxyectoine ABC transporter permease subunit EhuC [bacterium M00.F.Ca.ET.199.01.1.1]TGU17895.1 ectoine/hydroxyectoine ABC transporter permease 